ncbi:hypothetical protein CBOM_01892 [Ceraceosorus bombacis]|uniref:Uncharacterized protein n=1 Tax=Ceraceosorus bombacis TaxID=401625 RepID=A0A0P1BEF3_9BASI|nr:hypothetical protein CBOM_01892 [Ceraceosorus bombacis]
MVNLAGRSNLAGVAASRLFPSPARLTPRLFARAALHHSSRSSQDATPAQSSISNSSSSSSASSSPPPPSDPRTDRSRHRNFYRQILPPFIRVLGYSTAIYFSLQLLWTYLDAREQTQLEQEEKDRLIRMVREKRERGVEAGGGGGGILKERQVTKGWWGWIRGQK